MKTTASLLVGATLFCNATVSRAEPWARHTIDPANAESGKRGADGVRLGDINGDGHPDIATGWEEGEVIRVCVNPGPGKAKEPWVGVDVGKVSSAEDAVFADLDGDGHLDVVSATEGKSQTIYFHWCPSERNRLTDSEAWKTMAVPVTEGRTKWMFTLPRDIDRDGDTDLIVSSKDPNGTVSWLENPGNDSARQVEKWKLHRLTDAGWIMSLQMMEAKGEEYLVYSDRKGDSPGIYLAKAIAKSPWFEQPVLVGAAGRQVMFLDLAHLDDDQNLDIAVALHSDCILVLYQPEEVLQNWPDSAELDPLPTNKFGSPKAVAVGLIDDDEIPDFVITCEHANGKLGGALFSNMHSEFNDIGGPEGIKFDRIELLDLDADGDLDLLTCEERDQLGVFWYENPTKR